MTYIILIILIPAMSILRTMFPITPKLVVIEEDGAMLPDFQELRPQECERNSAVQLTSRKYCRETGWRVGGGRTRSSLLHPSWRGPLLLFSTLHRHGGVPRARRQPAPGPRRDSGRWASLKTEGQFMRWHSRLRVSGKMNWNETD